MKYYTAILALLFASTAQAQNWSGVLTPSRATNWSYAGLPTTLPDGETSANGWTPPVRTQCGSTVASGASFTTLNSDMGACSTGKYVLLGTGTFTGSGNLNPGNQNGVTLRGAGADKTTIKCQSGCQINMNNLSGGNGTAVNWTAGFSQGTTSLTFSALSGSGIVIGSALTLEGSGSGTDPGGPWVCSQAVTCSVNGDGYMLQYENHYVSGCDNVTTVGHACTNASFPVIIAAPGLSFSAWTLLTNKQAVGFSPMSFGVGLEDVTVDCSGNASCIALTYTYASWLKGVRVVNGSSFQLTTQGATNYLIANSYFVQPIAEAAEIFDINTDGFGLIINNIFNSAGSFVHGPGGQDVFAFNLARDAYNNGGGGYVNNTISNHIMGYSDALLEGNEIGDWQEDNVHGTANLNTFFRNTFYGNDPPYKETNNDYAIFLGGVARFENVIGNVMGSPEMTTYKCSPSSCSGIPVIVVGTGTAGVVTDTLSATSAMFWGNYDLKTAAIRWCGNSSNTGWSTTCASTSEVPTTMSGNAVPYQNTVPATQTLPASFFMPTTAYSSGGTGLSWWKVCTNYPTCSTFQTQPFPPIGPDVTGGDINGTGGFPNYAGLAYHIPAYVAWKNMPIDTSYQNSYSITGSSWSGGTETLTVTGPAGVLISGEFQISGGACAGTFMMTGSTSSTVSYALASNPGSCSGTTMKFPDVRQFNESVYQGTSPPAPAAVMLAISVH